MMAYVDFLYAAACSEIESEIESETETGKHDLKVFEAHKYSYSQSTSNGRIRHSCF